MTQKPNTLNKRIEIPALSVPNLRQRALNAGLSLKAYIELLCVLDAKKLKQ